MRVLSTVLLAAICLQLSTAQWYGHGDYTTYGNGGRYYGPLANPVVMPSGFLADTPEVSAAKAAHLGLVAGASATGYAGATGYVGPLARPVVTPSGFLADTPEVAAAKAAHLGLVAAAGGGYGHY